MLTNEFNILDAEASGLGDDSYPIEIGFIVAGEPTDSPAVSTSSFLINPALAPDWTAWDEIAESHHQIAREDLVQGVSPDVAANILNDRLRGKVVLVDSLEWDRFWLGRLYAAAEMTPTYELRSVASLLHERGGDEAVAAYHELVENEASQHRALPDALQTQVWLRKILSNLNAPVADLA